MAYRKHTRILTDEQFATNTTIDGSRIDAAMGDAVSRLNELQRKDLQRKLVPCHYVWGWQPEPEENFTEFVASVTAPGTGYVDGTALATTGGGGTGLTVDILTSAGAVTRVFVNAQGTGYSVGSVVTIQQGGSGNDATATLSASYTHHWPWLHTYNTSAGVLAGTGVPDVFLNPLRVKGCRVPGIINRTSAPDYPLGEQFAWTTELYVGRPAILDSLHLMLITDPTGSSNPYNGSSSFLWPAGYEPAGAEANDEHTDVAVSVQVADVFSPRDRGRDSLEVNRYNFKVERDAFTEIFLSQPPGNDMTPAFPQLPFNANPAGSAIQLKGLNVPLHQNSTARISVVLPRYVTTSSVGWWGVQPWSKQCYTLLVTTLEEME